MGGSRRGRPYGGAELWEVGDESYSCYETNEHLAGGPTFVHGYTAGRRSLPVDQGDGPFLRSRRAPYLWP